MNCCPRIFYTTPLFSIKFMCNSIIQIHFNLFFGGPYKQNLQINIIALNFNIFKYQRKNTVWSFSCAFLTPVVRVPIKREFFLQLRSPFHPPSTTALTERRTRKLGCVYSPSVSLVHPLVREFGGLCRLSWESPVYYTTREPNQTRYRWRYFHLLCLYALSSGNDSGLS